MIRKKKKQPPNVIHIRPNLPSLDEATVILADFPDLESHVGMISATNFILIMHDKDKPCFVCNQIESKKDAGIVF